MAVSPRAYNSPRRRAAAEQTRRDIISAAGRLFTDKGYAGTSIRAIAEAAELSPETVYLVFGTKAALLAAWIDASVVGDLAAVPLIERAEVQALMGLADFEERLAAAMVLGSAVNRRVCDPLAVLEAAAHSDPAIRDLATRIERARHEDVGRLMDIVLAGQPLRADVGRADVVRLVDAVISVHVYRALVIHGGWPVERYEIEMAHQVRQAMLGGAGAGQTPPS